MVAKVRVVNNLEIQQDSMLVSLNPKIYPLDVVYAASEPFMKKCFITISGDPEEELIVEFKPKMNVNLELLGRSFNNLLIILLTKKLESEKGIELKKQIVSRALKKEEAEVEEGPGFEEGYLEDRYGISKPWEEEE